MRIHCLQHVPFEGLGAIAKWIETKNHSLSFTRFHRQDPLPGTSDYDLVIVLGGPMSVHDEARYAWLTDEKQFIEDAIKNGKTVLGICLGAQLISDVLGGRVYKNAHKEIGWFPITLTIETEEAPIFSSLPKRFQAFHWHGETFDLPPGAVRMAETEACLNQAFLYGPRVIGLQFHLEATRESVKDLILNCSEELQPGRYIQSPKEMLLRPDGFVLINEMMVEILGQICLSISDGPRS